MIANSYTNSPIIALFGPFQKAPVTCTHFRSEDAPSHCCAAFPGGMGRPLRAWAILRQKCKLTQGEERA